MTMESRAWWLTSTSGFRVLVSSCVVFDTSILQQYLQPMPLCLVDISVLVPLTCTIISKRWVFLHYTLSVCCMPAFWQLACSYPWCVIAMDICWICLGVGKGRNVIIHQVSPLVDSVVVACQFMFYSVV